MKKLVLTGVFANLLLVSASSQAMTKSYIEQASQDVCQAIRSDSKVKLNKTLKSHRLSYQTVVKKLKCNGHDVMTFAAIEGAAKSAQQIALKTGKSPAQTLAKQ